MLYDISQRKTMRESIENHRFLCKHLGKKAISYDEYECRFNRCLNENYHSAIAKRDLPIPDIHVCILSDVIDRKTAEKSIDDLCDAFKNHNIDKEDHKCCFKRFRNGHASQVTFSDLPEDVLAEIIDRCDIQSYLNLRNVSHGLRTVIDQLAPPCTDIDFICRVGEIMVFLNGIRIASSELFDESQLRSELFRSLKTLELLLRNPKLRLESFEFITAYCFQVTEVPPRNHKQDFFDFLNSLNHKIHVEKCVMEVECEKEVIGVLKCLKPGKLEKLNIDMEHLNRKIDEVVKMDQWKLAKHLKIHTFELPPIENFFHFSTFELSFPRISMEDVVKLCENAFKSNSFEYCDVQIPKEFKLETIKRVLNLQPTASSKIYSIPNTNVFIKLIGYWGIERLKIYKK
ncbi:hypothetical protein CRE_29007 [Caenorhabditis remanei]|uniref:F-box domain-containing protein n=1 Tax=Caenorhabditis remanei TaxID=31234 RepID=E3N5G2_CAERE|nr:hypothetical protein CRE_29007 [Caenorhabditis remanei]